MSFRFMKRAPQASAPSTETNPYLNARRTWNDHVSGLADSRRMWQLVALSSMLIVLVAVAGLIAIGAQSKFVPYVVKVDKLGDAAAVSRAEQAGPVDPRVIQAQVGSFVQSARMVTPDIALQRQAIFRVYSMLEAHQPAIGKMNDFLNGTPEASPLVRAAKETVTVEISSVLQQTADTWQVDWVETVRDRDGNVTSPPAKMRALVTVHVVPPTEGTSEKQIQQNPLGIYVQDYTWSRVL
ncbi:VirB8/TrbF family protein [Novosphingobium terrae]|uniref:VirB8/TrbF family protein n=1 Tax=Novosphingobium terrae TaxID=2726189 RepID=UPI001F145CC3|nr:VirB8/TrbF family protein [Novosphingobium terrae]